QTEIDIVKAADTVTVVLNPESGDDIQAFKAGIMEIADIFVINKADLPGSGRARISIETAVHESKAKNDWHIPVIMTSSFKIQGIEELWEKLTKHFAYLSESGELAERRFKNLREEVIALVEHKIKNYLELKLKEGSALDSIKRAGEKDITSRIAANEIFKKL
ncbi:methylmalonyl Co-A mutase-associated GTPase MeaB, partial [bacterium]